MLARRLLLRVAIVLGNMFAFAAGLFAQVNPSDMRSGAVMGIEPGMQTLLFVPEGFSFVLTDLELYGRFSTGDFCEVLMLLGGSLSGNNRWSMAELVNLPAGTAFQTVPMSAHWTTGLVFSSGEQVYLDVLNIISGRRWDATWSGYLVGASPGAVGEESTPAVPTILGQNAPNPFNPTTEIKYSLASPGEAKLRFLDPQGRVVRTLVDERKEAGEYAAIWDGRNDSGELLASGVYYYELRIGTATQARKAVLLK